MKVAVYISSLNRIGGVETFAINLCNRTGFDLIYSVASMDGLKKLKYNYYNHRYCKKEYDVVILATVWKPHPNFDKLRAKKYIQMVHADYTAYIEEWNFKYEKYPQTTHHVCVGNHVAEMFTKATGYRFDKVIHNLLEPYNPKKIKSKQLSFITLSRFSKEKGFYRVLQMAEIMKDEDYVWNIYGDTSTPYAKLIIPKLKRYRQINIKGITNTAKDEIVKHDYLVQLSNTEGFPYSVYESLQCLTPVITTDYPSVHELIKDGENGYILDMQLSNFCVNKIKSIPLINSFKEKSTEKDWFKFINEIIKEDGLEK